MEKCSKAASQPVAGITVTGAANCRLPWITEGKPDQDCCVFPSTSSHPGTSDRTSSPAIVHQLLGRVRPNLDERDHLLTMRAIDPRVSSPLLFLIAEQSPDAREAARELAGPRLEDIHRGALVESIEDLALERFEAILERADRLAGLRPGADAPFDERATQALFGLCWSGLVQMVARLLDRPRVELAYQAFDTPQQAFERCCQSNRNSSPIGRAVPYPASVQAMSNCHSARAAERRAL